MLLVTVTQIIRLVVLGRILGPEAFGLLAMMLVVTGFAEQLGQMGLSEAIIQRPDPTYTELSSLYWLNIALGGLIAAGLDGIQNEMMPPEPVLVDPGDMEESERKKRGIDRLPTSLEEAVDALGRDKVLMEAMGEVLSREYLLIKLADWEDSRDRDVESELQRPIHRY